MVKYLVRPAHAWCAQDNTIWLCWNSILQAHCGVKQPVAEECVWTAERSTNSAGCFDSCARYMRECDTRKRSSHWWMDLISTTILIRNLTPNLKLSSKISAKTLVTGIHSS